MLKTGKNIKCGICKKTFYLNKYRLDHGSKYCSNKCNYKSKIGVGIGIRKGKDIECGNCGKIFYANRGEIKRDRRCCSLRCMRIFRRGKPTHILTHRVEKECLLCKKKFDVVFSRRGQDFCSRRCTDKVMIGEESRNWKGGFPPKGYAYGFTESFKRKIRARDHFICRLCKKNKERLAVHHIDYNKNNHNLDNLITLCNSCHSRTNGNRDTWKNKLIKLLNQKQYALSC